MVEKESQKQMNSAALATPPVSKAVEKGRQNSPAAGSVF